MSQPWSKSLVRSSFSEWLVDDAIREANGAISPDVEALLRTSAEKRSQVSELKKALSSVKPLISTGTFEVFDEELAEIREDFSWAKSKRGKYVSEIQDWVQTFHADLRAQKKFDDLYVGGHESLEIVYVVGKADSEEVLNELIEFLHEKNPPRKIMTKVTISGDNKG
ncbi:MAG: hypothetical protein R3F19_25705 [Verrucomicrobiales bacterium]